MPELSACYFCGTALDEPLSEYPVVPKTLQPTPDQQQTVVLCSTCRRKLGKVVDAVLTSVDETSLDDTIQQDLPDAGPGTAADAGGGREKPTDDAADEDATEAGWSSVEDDVEDTTSVDEEPAEEHAESDDALADPEESEQSASPDDQPAVELDLTPPPDANRDADDAATDRDTDKDDPLGEPTDVTAADGAGDEGDDDDPSLTALEYTKVMRLLENRDLPVDREEIRVVATNAYEIRPDEFDAVVEAAIDRGLIVEENGQFVDIE